MAQRRAEGVHTGRPAALSPDLYRRILDLHAASRSLNGIATLLTTEGVPTARGGSTWHASTVRAIVTSRTAAALTASR
jgi:hypothetical protein